MKSIEENIKIFKDTWDDFVEQVHDYMDRANWFWFDTNHQAPSTERIKTMLDELLEMVVKDSQCVSSGGFKLKRNNDNTLDCEFDGKIFHRSYDPNQTEFDDFFKYLCKTNDILTIEYLRKKYREFVRYENQ